MKTKPGGIFIAAGSNLEDRAAHILTGLRDLESAGDILVLQRSTLREYPPVGGPANQPPYLNAVAEISTRLEPAALLARLHEIEALHGRVRAERDGPRTLDLDLILYHDRIIQEADMMVPHPRMLQRAFVIDPLREIGGAASVELARRLLSGMQPATPDAPADRAAVGRAPATKRARESTAHVR